MHKKNTRNELRIIGGRWRSRRIPFPALPGVRPTPDRVRETLFNWLQYKISGSRCLDLFAGSGALGLEALSRGASEVVFVDRERAISKHLQDMLETLGAQNAEVHIQDAHDFLATPATPFDVVFLDPPFTEDCLEDICAMLEANGWLAEDAHIFLEHSSQAAEPALPQAWALHKSQRAGAVGYHLARRENDYE